MQKLQFFKNKKLTFVLLPTIRLLEVRVSEESVFDKFSIFQLHN